MEIIAKKPLRYAGKKYKKDDKLSASKKDAKVLVLIGKAKYAPTQEDSKRAKVIEAEKPKRQYTRRDMTPQETKPKRQYTRRKAPTQSADAE